MSASAPGTPLASVVYAAISEDILGGTLPPGTPLVQEQLAERYAVSRTPVRDALTQLTTDGLVRQAFGAGYYVADLSTNDINDVLSVRRELESLALRQAFGRHTPRQLHQLAMLAGEIRFADETNGTDTFELAAQFHKQLLDPCQNAYLLEIIEQVWANPVQRRILLTYTPGKARSERIATNHEAIVNALASDDLNAALGFLHDCHDVAIASDSDSNGDCNSATPDSHPPTIPITDA